VLFYGQQNLEHRGFRLVFLLQLYQMALGGAACVMEQ